MPERLLIWLRLEGVDIADIVESVGDGSRTVAADNLDARCWSIWTSNLVVELGVGWERLDSARSERGGRCEGGGEDEE